MPCRAADRQVRHFAGQVADFGCAHVAPPPGVEGKQLRRGTLAYQPPELLERGVGSPAGDCYAFGVLLWEMLTAQARPGLPHSVALGFSARCCDFVASGLGIPATCGAGCIHGRQELRR